MTMGKMPMSLLPQESNKKTVIVVKVHTTLQKQRANLSSSRSVIDINQVVLFVSYYTSGQMGGPHVVFSEQDCFNDQSFDCVHEKLLMYIF